MYVTPQLIITHLCDAQVLVLWKKWWFDTITNLEGKNTFTKKITQILESQDENRFKYECKNKKCNFQQSLKVGNEMKMHFYRKNN